MEHYHKNGVKASKRQSTGGFVEEGMSFLADFFEPRLVQSHSTVIIPLYKCSGYRVQSLRKGRDRQCSHNLARMVLFTAIPEKL
jgi:hypothetical protein